MSQEFLDVVNEEDLVIDSKPRKEVHQLGLWHRGAHVFLFTEDGKLLVQKRSADRSTAPSMLDCSVSEHVQAGESYYNAAIRGMKEELGLENIEIKRLHKFRMEYGPNDNEISELYEGRVNPMLVNHDPSEIESIHYYEMNELIKLTVSNENIFCGWFIELINLHQKGTGKMELMD